MGYYTWFSMQARNVKSKEEYESIVETLKKKRIYDESNDNCGVFCESTYYENEQEANFSVCDECKWYDHVYDMMQVSKIFPDVVFRLCGDGEEREDMWRKYFHNGAVEECQAQVTFPKPVEIEWEE